MLDDLEDLTLAAVKVKQDPSGRNISSIYFKSEFFQSYSFRFTFGNFLDLNFLSVSKFAVFQRQCPETIYKDKYAKSEGKRSIWTSAKEKSSRNVPVSEFTLIHNLFFRVGLSFSGKIKIFFLLVFYQTIYFHKDHKFPIVHIRKELCFFCNFGYDLQLTNTPAEISLSASSKRVFYNFPSKNTRPSFKD